MNNINLTSQWEFTYNDSLSYEQNFTEWRQLNRKEREVWNDTPITIEQAQTIFDAQYGAKKPGSVSEGQ